MSLWESLKRMLGGTPSSGGAPGGNGAPGGDSVAMIPCEEVAARLFEYLDGELESLSEEEVRVHLEDCERCYPRVEFEKHFLDALQRSQNGGRASDDLRKRVLDSIAEDGRQD